MLEVVLTALKSFAGGLLDAVASSLLPGRRRTRKHGQGGTRPKRPARRPSGPRRSPGAPTGPSGVRELRILPRFEYAPRNDGLADPGEVVWAWVPFEDDPSQGKDRPVLVLGHAGQDLAVVTLTSKDHGRGVGHRGDRVYMDIGTGAWDQSRRPSEARVDRVIAISPSAVRREGARVERAVFEQVAQAVTQLH
ncbi:MAG: type II toxin-antitoxin system PemK/MazF family toxin [Buchananella hordeovulneris]|nr:type II toxin-antitoxin system PemK/MazF family toxin [Buchananella hordeovulneris]